MKTEQEENLLDALTEMNLVREENAQLRARVVEALKHVSIVADSLNSNDPKHRPHKDSIEVICTALKAKEILSNE